MNTIDLLQIKTEKLVFKKENFFEELDRVHESFSRLIRL